MTEETITLFPPASPLDASIQLSGSKSFMNRALILAALAQEDSILLNPSRSEDSLTLLRLLKYFGVESRWQDGGSLKVLGRHSRGQHCIPKEVELHVGHAGTVMRFMTSLAAVSPGATVTLSGSQRMHERPIGALVDALRSLGAKIEYLGKEGCPPLQIHGQMLHGGMVEIDGGISSQFLTSILLVGATLRDGLEIKPKGEIVSRSYLQMTCQTMQQFGIDVEEREHGGYLVKPGEISGTEYLVEGDASGASYFWGLPAVSGGRISLSPFPSTSLQGDIGFPRLLERMGCKIEIDDTPSSISVIAPTGRLQPIEANMENMPDTAQTLAVLAAIAEGTSHLTGLKTLRIKETDRIHALQEELAKVGVQTEATDDSLTIHGISPVELKRASIQTYDDHRMAMSFALLGAVIPGLVIEHPSVVTKSFPDFWERLRSVGFQVS